MLRLKAHAIAICLCLFSLIAVLGFKAYRVGRTHFDETRTLVESDFRSQELLLRMEASASARDQALRKLRVTQDPIYRELADRHGEIIQTSAGELKESLGLSYPDLAGIAPTLTTMSAMHELGGELDHRRDQKLRHAREDALGILQLIMLALVLSVGITAWLLTLFFKGLLEPLGTIKQATRRIREGELSHRIEPARGVTELRDVTRSFNSMAERLESLDQAKTEFLATVSHEIKNPLAAVKEGLSLLASQGEVLTPLARQKSFSACLIASKRLEFLLNNLLHHSRMEAGLYRFDVSTKNLSGAIQAAMDEVRPLADRKKMSLLMSAPSELPASFNWEGMVQVFSNLLLNAVKYGTESTTIEVRAQAGSRAVGLPTGPGVPQIEVAVINTGTPIPESEVPKLFERFYRGSNSARANGVGLGLHVVRKIVEAHHGTVAAASAGGRTRIELQIPGRYETEATC